MRKKKQMKEEIHISHICIRNPDATNSQKCIECSDLPGLEI